MSTNEDELLLGSIVPGSKEARDSDGDGVSDVEEELVGTDPNVAGPVLEPLDVIDPRADLERPDLEREVGFDPAAAMPEGKDIVTGLGGLTNLDGSDLGKGPNHHFDGEDELLAGHGSSNNPVDMQRDPFATTPAASAPPSPRQGEGVASAGGGSKTEASGGGHGSTPPPGADLGSRAPDGGLVSGEADGGTAPGFLDKAAKAVNDLFKDKPEPPTPDAGTKRPAGDTPVSRPKSEAPPTPGSDKDYVTNPDADPVGTAGTATSEDIEAAIARHGGEDTRPMEGTGAGPGIDDDGPSANKRDLVTDPGDEGSIDSIDSTGTGGLPGGSPDAPVVRPVNPGGGFVAPPGGPPPSGGGGGQGDGDLLGGSAAATAAPADGDTGSGVAEISPIGSGGGGISSTVESPDADAGAAAVDSFATEYLEDASLDALSPDLGEDLTQVDGDLGPDIPDLGAAPLDDVAPPEPDDTLDDI